MREDGTSRSPRFRASCRPSARAAAGAEWIARLASPINGGEVGPLAGLTFAVKDNIDVAGVATTAGCPAFAYRSVEHATVVRKLVAAGAGKTNLDQFAKPPNAC